MKENAYTSRFVSRRLSKRNRDLSHTSSSGNHAGKRNIDLRQQAKLRCSESVADKEKKKIRKFLEHMLQFLRTGGIFATICGTNYIEVQVKVKAAP